MTDTLWFQVGPDDAGRRADVAVAGRLPDLSRSLVQRLFADGNVLVSGREVQPGKRLRSGEEVMVRLELPPSLSAEPEDIPLNIVYEDGDLAVIDKPAGLAVHPSPGHERGTLANALLARYPGAAAVGDPFRPGIVHRLDMDTSGLMVVALNPHSHSSLQRQLSSREMQRAYLALATGHPKPPAGIIDAPIGRDPQNRRRMAVGGIASRSARTHYKVLEHLPSFALIEARLETGRTHQIRVHLAAVGHPVAGDALYRGAPIPGLRRQFLHAYRLALRSPSSGAELAFHSPLPPDLQRALAAAA